MNDNNREFVIANEAAAYYMTEDAAWEDRKNFVHNLGVLLAQTREQIIGAFLDENDRVHILYRHDYEEIVNVRMDSYTAIIKDVVKTI